MNLSKLYIVFLLLILKISSVSAFEYDEFISGDYRFYGCRSDKFFNEGQDKAVLFIIRDNDGLILESSREHAGYRAYVRFKDDFRDAELVDVSGGMWSILYTRDLMDNLQKRNIEELSGKGISYLINKSLNEKCDFVYRGLNIYNRIYESVDSDGSTIASKFAPDMMLNADVLQKFKAWKNEYGRPWSASGYDPNLCLTSMHAHSVRMGAALNILLYINTRNLLDEIDRLAGQEDMSSLEWGRNYISEISGISSKYLLIDLIAFYHSPFYKSGSLPSTVENLLAFENLSILDSKIIVKLKTSTQSILNLMENTKYRINSVNSYKCVDNGTYIAGYDIRYFLDHIYFD